MYTNIVYNPWRDYKPVFKAKPFNYKHRLVAPPPNITGGLHVGHVLNLVLQCVLSAELEQRGAFVQRVVGLDHAGLAVKHILALKRGSANVNMFWSWKRRIGRRLLFEIKRVLSLRALSGTRFTLDRPFAAAAACAFVRLYNAKLVSSKFRLLWWDCKLNSVVSKLETSSSCERLWVRAQRFAFESGEAIVWDWRREVWIKTNYVLSSRVTSNVCALIVSLAELSLWRLNSIRVIDAISGNRLRLIVSVGSFELNRCVVARALVNVRVVLALINTLSQYLNMLIAVKALVCVSVCAHTKTCYSLRTGALVQRRLINQWFVNLHSLLSYCDVSAVRTEPRRWKRVLLAWIADLGLWCVSRTMDWGHRLPVWRLGCAFVVRDTKLKAFYYLILNNWAPLCRYRADALMASVGAENLVFDTWFSSALWCLSCLGWPNKTRQLRLSVSASIVITGFDIIFFWVLKMLLVSCFLMNAQLPFVTVVIHPIVCDAWGQKMSKTKNNAISPGVLFNAFGSQSVRLYFSGVNLSTQQFKMCLNTLLACRNASTKFWHLMRMSLNCSGAAVCSRYVCKWTITSVFIRIKRTALALRAFNIDIYLNELLNLIKFDLNNYVNLNSINCRCVRIMCDLICWRYRAVVPRASEMHNLDTCYIGAFAVTAAVFRLLLLINKASTVCTNCKRVFSQAVVPLRELNVRSNIIYFNKLRLSVHWQVGLWCNSLFAWR
ncbi:Valine--tRNA ligase [Candidatus Hodgkinia cicadicola]|nr:Valine--tRNA ligase [Candidatus Hodgkinia cicadicola]